jgi:hypothetical protein
MINARVLLRRVPADVSCGVGRSIPMRLCLQPPAEPQVLYSMFVQHDESTAIDHRVVKSELPSLTTAATSATANAPQTCLNGPVHMRAYTYMSAAYPRSLATLLQHEAPHVYRVPQAADHESTTYVQQTKSFVASRNSLPSIRACQNTGG